ncbi:hypothetical protein HER39_09380, partial [Arthrobacter deserti]|nr:hypothetical protein [Arthrobacter deserti]
MIKALTFGAGLAVGYVFGTKAGRQRYEQLKAQAGKFLNDPRTREKIAGAKESVMGAVPGAKDRSPSSSPRTRPDVVTDPAHNAATGNDWSDEGGATTAGPATNTDPAKEPDS